MASDNEQKILSRCLQNHRVLYYKSYKDFQKKHFKNNSNATKEKWEVEDGAGV